MNIFFQKWRKILANPAVFWIIFCVLLVTSSGLAATVIVLLIYAPNENEPATESGGHNVAIGGPVTAGERLIKIWQNPEFCNYLWQSILHCLTTYCALIPILENKRSGSMKYLSWSRRTRKIADIAFRSTVVLGFITAICAPAVFLLIVVTTPGDGVEVPVLAQALASGFNFASVVFSTAAAGQLAARVATT